MKGLGLVKGLGWVGEGTGLVEGLGITIFQPIGSLFFLKPIDLCSKYECRVPSVDGRPLSRWSSLGGSVYRRQPLRHITLPLLTTTIPATVTVARDWASVYV